MSSEDFEICSLCGKKCEYEYLPCCWCDEEDDRMCKYCKERKEEVMKKRKIRGLKHKINEMKRFQNQMIYDIQRELDELSVTPEKLLETWFKGYAELREDRHYENVVHANGWIFWLCRFRNRPGEKTSILEARVSMGMKIDGRDGEDDIYRLMDRFVRTAFDIDFNDCYLEELLPLLRWCEKKKSEVWLKEMKTMIKSYKF